MRKVLTFHIMQKKDTNNLQEKLRRKIVDNFSRFSDDYDSYAHLQKKAAKKLYDYFIESAFSLPSESILELGCGTGFLSEYIAKNHNNHKIIFSDLSDMMLQNCRMKVEKFQKMPEDFSFEIIDGEKINDENKYAMIASGFTFQWFSDLHESLENIMRALVKNGIALFSIPVRGSFPEWKKACSELNLPFNANELPDADGLIEKLHTGAGDIQFKIEEEDLSYPSAIHFFQSIKQIGAATAISEKPLSAGQMKRLCRKLDSIDKKNFHITYKVMYCCIRV